MGPEPWMATCERCGGPIEKPPMGIPLDAFVRAGLSEHSGCARDTGGGGP